ncbi:MAG: universal stress protein [Propionicimonas sp.]|nr:universal stress protein [Propionicimonas sp.]
MRIGIWLTEGAWPAAVDAAAEWQDDASEVVLLHVAGGGAAEVVGGAYGGLWGRGRRRDPAASLAAEAGTASTELLERAAARLGRPCQLRSLGGRPERAVTAAADALDLLVVARDGDLSRLGPRSLGPETRFVVDHAPCRVLLVWPGTAPGLGSIPPPPAGPPEPDRR